MTRKITVSALAMLLMIAVCSTAQAQGRLGRGSFGGFGGDPLLSLVRIDKVLEELEVIDDQKEQIQKIVDGSRGERPQVNFRELSEEEREKALAEFREKAQARFAEARKKLDDVLLPHQLKRLKEISIQNQGIRALADKELAKAIGMTDEQQEELVSIQEGIAESFRELFRGGQDRENIREKMTELREKSQSDIMAVLTDDQKQKFEEMKGEPFKMPERQFRGGRRRPGQSGQRPKRPSID